MCEYTHTYTGIKYPYFVFVFLFHLDKDANISMTGDQVILVGAASKGIIQRGFQHNATVYKTPYAKNPFDAVTDQELEEYKRDISRKQKGESSCKTVFFKHKHFNYFNFLGNTIFVIKEKIINFCYIWKIKRLWIVKRTILVYKHVFILAKLNFVSINQFYKLMLRFIISQNTRTIKISVNLIVKY